jgi:hypothetical protein
MGSGGYAKASDIQNDDPATSPQLSASGYGKVDFEGYVNFDDAGANINLQQLVNGKGNMLPRNCWNNCYYRITQIPAAGYTVVIQKINIQSYCHCFGVIGDGTPKGWDTKMQ